jgi:hypothetical protein
MIVGIVPTGAGVAQVIDLRTAADVASGLSAFVNAYTPPLDPADFVAFDTGWPGPKAESPGDGMVWGFDRDSATLEAITAPADFVFAAASKMEAKIVTSNDWEIVDGLITNISAITGNPNNAVGKAIGQVKVAGSGFQLRFTKGDARIPISADYDHSDTGGAFEIFGFYTNAPPDAGDQVYALEARLNGATSAELRFASLSLSMNRTPHP